MNVLFVCSGNSENGIGTVVSNQAEALIKRDVSITFYPIKGKGYRGYLKHSFLLRKYIQENRFDVIHAHYSLSAFAATLAGCKPLVVSLMGSDARAGVLTATLIRHFQKNRWKDLIVKSSSMEKQLKLNSPQIVGNGVDLSFFKPMDPSGLKEKFGFSPDKRTILFLADPARKSKNYPLADRAFQILANDETELQVKYNVPKEEIPEMINAADVVLLTSKWEGSPNVIKETMACNKPVVATNVGDIPWLFGSEQGHYITNFTPDDVAEKLKSALDFAQKQKYTTGRKRLEKLGLDSVTVADKIISIYSDVADNV